jgi:ribulose-phosphate 3-epimerase
MSQNQAPIHLARQFEIIFTTHYSAVKYFAINLLKSEEDAEDIIQDVYMVLIMSVNPGFGGQKFIEHSVEKVRELRALIERTGSKALIEVDGGVNLETGARLVEAGADVLVAGNAVFGAPDPEEMIRQLHKL